MSSPPKKMRKNAAGGGGGGVADANASGSANDSMNDAPANAAEPVTNDNNDIEMDDDLDPAAMYEDEEGTVLMELFHLFLFRWKINLIRFLCTFIV